MIARRYPLPTKVACLALFAAMVLASPPVCGEPAAADSVRGPSVMVADFRARLLSTAFDAASAMPLYPHVKTRSRLQEDVAVAYLAIDRPEEAVSCVDAIVNWRSGLVRAELGVYWAEQGNAAKARRELELAELTIEKTEDWRRDRLRARIADGYLLLGEEETSARMREGVALAEQGKEAIVRADVAPAETFGAQIAGLQAVLAEGEFDPGRNALDALAQLYRRSELSGERREAVRELVLDTVDELPVLLRLDYRERLGEGEIAVGNKGAALALAEEMRGLIEAYSWLPRDRYEWTARAIGLAARAGQRETAVEEARALLAEYRTERERIVNIWRADALVPLAEAFLHAGDRVGAMEAYMLALEEMVVNPNSRPRAEDLVATCISMALNGAEPTSTVWGRIESVKDQLGDPW